MDTTEAAEETKSRPLHPFFCGMLVVLLAEFLGWMFYRLPNPAEDVTHAFVYAIAVMGIIVAIFALLLTAFTSSR